MGGILPRYCVFSSLLCRCVDVSLLLVRARVSVRTPGRGCVHECGDARVSARAWVQAAAARLDLPDHVHPRPHHTGLSARCTRQP